MGRLKKGFNWKAREVVDIKVDNSKVTKIKLDNDTFNKGQYDESNLLALPSKKRESKKKKSGPTHTRILSKTQRKKLEKVIEKKKKKEGRTELLEKLSQVQATPDQLSHLSSITTIQTKGLKRSLTEDARIVQRLSENAGETGTPINSLSGRKRRRLMAIEAKKNKPQNNDPSIVGFEQSESESEDEVEEESPIDDNHQQIKMEEMNIQIKEEPLDETETLEVLKTVQPLEKVPELKTITLKPETASKTPTVFVPVNRTDHIQAARLKLPILAEEQTIMEVINENSIIIIAGETGSGKTTQVPQFLYEAGYAREKMIGITEPRRVAAISMSKRVAIEMNLSEDEVSYLIRFEGNCTPNTKLKFMTDGVLLKEMQIDFLLSKYSVIILDEAHERSIHTDILIGLLSRIVPLRNKRNLPMKLIIMSATLRVEDFTENSRLFKVAPPVIKVETRQFPVTIHFNKRTNPDYLKECYNKTCKIHNQLPDGGILVFVTGQQEVNTLVRKLRKTFPFTNNVEDSEEEEIETKTKKRKKKKEIKLPDVCLDKYDIAPTDDTEGDLLEANSDDDDDLSDLDSETTNVLNSKEPMWVLPLYSLLPSNKQARVFEPPPEGCRLCVVATNVAETSLTIPCIKYVVDCGKTKAKLYDKVTGVSAFQIINCSKAAANQRAGRAGRMGPGHCYRLYSSAMFNDEFPQFSVPEIQQKPVDDLILQMKAMNIVKVVNFPFPSSPDIIQLKSAERRLTILGALQEPGKQDEWNSKLTRLGETMACFPVSPRYAKMLALSCQYDLLQYVVCIVAALSVPQLLLDSNPESNWGLLRRAWAGTGNSLLLGDPMILLRAVGAAEYSLSKLEEFCSKHGLRHKAVVEIRKLRIQLTNQISLNIPDVDLSVDPNMKPPTDEQAKLLRQIMLAGMADQVAHKVDPSEVKEEDRSKWKRAYRCCEMEEPVFLHKSSVLSKQLPEWVVFQEVYETNKLYMRNITAIEPEWLPVFVPALCNLSDPLEEPPPRYDETSGHVYCHVTGTFSKAAFQLPTVEIPYIKGLDSFKWFANFLLDGSVVPKLQKFSKSLLSAPSSMTKSWAKLQPRTEILLKELVSKDVNTKDKLQKVWETDSNYLLSAYKQWLPESAHAELTVTWPPV